MKNNTKIAFWIGGALFLAVGGTMTYTGIKKSNIRKRLNEAYNDPSGVESVGGMDKLLVSEIFDKRAFQTYSMATISKVEARERAKEVWENYGAYFFTSSDTSAIIGAFDNLGHIHDVSKIAFEFFNSYDEELLTALDYALGEDSSQKNILIDKLLKLPNNKI